MTNSLDDIANDARSYLIIGSNTTEQHPVLGMCIRQAVRRRGAKLIIADPRRIPLAKFAALHLRHKPGSDIALLNAIMHVLITEDLHDKEFVAQRTEGFEELKALLEKYTLEYAEKITDVPASDIRKAARLLAANRPGALILSLIHISEPTRPY